MHVRTNEIKTQPSPETIAAHIIKVCDGLKNSENDVSVSGLVYRKYNDENRKVDEINKILKPLCAAKKLLLHKKQQHTTKIFERPRAPKKTR